MSKDTADRSVPSFEECQKLYGKSIGYPKMNRQNLDEKTRVSIPLVMIFSGIGIIIALTIRIMMVLAVIDVEIALLKNDRAYLLTLVRDNAEAIKVLRDRRDK